MSPDSRKPITAEIAAGMKNLEPPQRPPMRREKIAHQAAKNRRAYRLSIRASLCAHA
jgi:hypothetical protein